MATKTTNYNLVKPDITEPSLIDDINANMDKIDAALKDNADAIGDIETLLDIINGEVI